MTKEEIQKLATEYARLNYCEDLRKEDLYIAFVDGYNARSIPSLELCLEKAKELDDGESIEVDNIILTMAQLEALIKYAQGE